MTYQNTGKRIFDLIVASVILVCTLPVIALMAIVLLAVQGSPIIYRQQRVGRYGKSFCLYKFRSMSNRPVESARFLNSVSPPVTPMGKLIRAHKLDEWPQLWNVIMGDMSLVGPRPETPEWVDLDSETWRKLLTVRPGITDTASIKYRHEEQLLKAQSNPREFYRTRVLPDKQRLGQRYVETLSFESDCRIIVRTLLSVLPGGQRILSRHARRVK